MRVIPDPAEAAVLAREIAVMATTEDVELIRRALAYAIELYRELTGENGAPTLGTQNQIVDFILADPELCQTVTRWGWTVETDEATIRPPRRRPMTTPTG